MTPPSSQNKASKTTPAPQGSQAPEDTTPPTTPPEETEEQRKAREEAEQAAANQEKDSEKRKGNLAKVEDVETYNPYLDPDVPDSNLADIITAELKGSGESPTLEALRSAKKEEEKKEDE